MNLSNDFKETITSFMHETLEAYLYSNIPGFLNACKEYTEHYNELKLSLNDSFSETLLTDLFEKQSELYHYVLVGISIYAIKIYGQNNHIFPTPNFDIASKLENCGIRHTCTYMKLKSSISHIENSLLPLLDDTQNKEYNLYKKSYSSFQLLTARECFKATLNIIRQL